MPPDPCAASIPWYRFPMVWMVFGGPAIVVVASLVTCVIAYRFGDPPLADHASRTPASTAPALAARNHAATAGR